MGYDDGIVIDVGHPRVRPDFLGDLVGVVGGWQAAADVYELTDAQVAGQFLGGLPVGSEIILSAKKVVVDPRNVRDGDI